MPPPATILMVADDAGMRAFLGEVLRRQGYEVLTAADVPEAEALGQRWGTQAPHLPFILISDERLSGRLEPPVVWWLAKPLTPDTLLVAVRDSLGA